VYVVKPGDVGPEITAPADITDNQAEVSAVNNVRSQEAVNAQMS
jgi:hypothetical protein